MDSKQVYSSSLKRMLGFKLFPNINPEQILKVDSTKNNNQKLTDFVESKKTDQQIEKMKKQISEARKKQQLFQKEIDSIVGKMVEDGFAQVVSKKVRKHGSSHKLRIVTEPDEGVSKSKKSHHVRSSSRRNLESWQKVEQSNNQEINNVDKKQRWKIPAKLPEIKQEKSVKQINGQRLKTQVDLRKKYKEEPEPYNADNAERLIRHYRDGMTSLKKLKIRVN